MVGGVADRDDQGAGHSEEQRPTTLQHPPQRPREPAAASCCYPAGSARHLVTECNTRLPSQTHRGIRAIDITPSIALPAARCSPPR